MIFGTLTLSDNLVLSGLETAAPAVHSARRLIGGAVVVQSDANIGGRVLRLNSANHLALSDVEQIQSLFAAGQPITVTHHRGTFTVVITGMDLAPARDHANPYQDALYSGDIYLQEL